MRAGCLRGRWVDLARRANHRFSVPGRPIKTARVMIEHPGVELADAPLAKRGSDSSKVTFSRARAFGIDSVLTYGRHIEGQGEYYGCADLFLPESRLETMNETEVYHVPCTNPGRR